MSGWVEQNKTRFLLENRLAFSNPRRNNAILTGVVESDRAPWSWGNFAAILRRRAEVRLGFTYGHLWHGGSNHCARCGQSRYQLVWGAGTVDRV